MAHTIHQPLIALGRIGFKRGFRTLADAAWNVIECGVECLTGMELSVCVLIEALTGVALSEAAAAYAILPFGSLEGLGDLRFHLKTSLAITFDEDVRRVVIERFLMVARQLVARV